MVESRAEAGGGGGGGEGALDLHLRGSAQKLSQASTDLGIFVPRYLVLEFPSAFFPSTFLKMTSCLKNNILVLFSV